MEKIKKRISINADEAEDIHEKATEIIAIGIKDKIKHPFRDKNQKNIFIKTT